MNESTAFYAYGERPPNPADSIRAAVRILRTELPGLEIRLWEDLKTGGKVIVEEVLSEIDSAQLLLADLTDLNLNVLYELGYAMGRDKHLWLTADDSRPDYIEQIKRLSPLNSIGRRTSASSKRLVSDFKEDRPDKRLGKTFFQAQIQKHLRLGRRDNLLVLKQVVETQASVEVQEVLDGCELPKISLDPTESPLRSIAWCSEQLSTCAAVVAFFNAPQMVGAIDQNRYYSLLCGLARALNKPILMLSDEDFVAPFDYQDCLATYKNSTEARQKIETFLEPIVADFRDEEQARKASKVAAVVSTNLRDLDFGDIVAENEQTFLQEVFVQTAAYFDALRGSHKIFVGRRGTGKSAIMLMVAEKMRSQPRTLIVEMKPPEFQADALVDLLKPLKDTQLSFVIEALWKNLLLGELIRELVDLASEKLQPTVADLALLRLASRDRSSLLADFGIRLSFAVNRCLTIKDELQKGSPENAASLLGDAIYKDLFAKYKHTVAESLEGIDKVCILVDNLDRSWDRYSKVGVLSRFYLGLLNVAQTLPKEFRGKNKRNARLEISATVFLRGDVFADMLRYSKEPDKIAFREIDWRSSDPLLAQIIEDRAMKSSITLKSADEVWTTLFCPNVGKTKIREYVLQSVMPRPRDILFFVQQARDNAINGGRNRIEEQDILDAQASYDDFLIKSMAVELGYSSFNLDDVLLELVGAPFIMSHRQLVDRIEKSGYAKGHSIEVIRDLCRVGILGFGLAETIARYVWSAQDFEKMEKHVNRMSGGNRGKIHYEVNPIFRRYLESTDPTAQLS